jgi:hypothetical protein
MKRLLLIALITCSTLMQAGTTVREAFQTETPQAKPWCYWYWMHGCVSKAGIEADLQAMQESGLGGAFLFSIRGTEKPSKFEPAVETLSPEWFQLVKYAVQEAGKRNLQLGMHISDGFALAGGPWIKPEQAMQQVVWSEKNILGGRILHEYFPKPTTVESYYRDIAVYAYPTPNGVSLKTRLPESVREAGKTLDLSLLADPENSLSIRREDSLTLIYDYKKPFLCRSIVTKVNGNSLQCHRFLVEASDDGIHYRRVSRLEPPRHGWQNVGMEYFELNVTHAIPPTSARFFRFTWSKDGTPVGAEDMDNAKWKPVLRMLGILLSSEPKIDQFEGKNGSVWRVSKATTDAQLPAVDCVDPRKMINLTSKIDTKGQLHWKAPKGRWTILRIGHTPTGTTNATAGAGAGLECDKFNPEAVQSQFNHWFGRICDSIGSEQVGRVLSILHIDSWECGSQNWSEHFADEFAKRRGYDLLPWLPVMAGVPMVSHEKSEQILRDVRQTQAELIHDVFFQIMADNAHAKGLQISAESVAPTMTSDGMLHFDKVDYSMGEFWLNSPTHDKPNDMLDAISGAHIYGKNVVLAEGFTQLRNNWNEAPSNLKSLLDLQFANGLNKMVFHVFVHNPFLNRKPGMTLDGLGLFFQRDQTWWKPAKAWMDYIQRCQRLLQLGRPVTDIAVFGGLELPSRALLPDRLVPSLPGIFGAERVESERIRLENVDVPLAESPVGVTHAANLALAPDWVNPLRGYSYDTFNPDVLFKLKNAEKGRFSLPGGASYGLFVIPLAHPMAPDSLSPYKDLELRVRDVIDRLRESNVPVLLPSTIAKDLSVKALVPWQEADFSSIGIPRDLEIHENGKEAFQNVAFTHRADTYFDLYFLSNQSDKARNLDLSFRVSGRIPEVFDPVDGSISEIQKWTTDGNRTRIQLKMEPSQALFVVFEKQTTASSQDLTEQPQRKLDCPGLQGPWTVQFDTDFGGPAAPVVFPTLTSWSLQPSSEVKFYSGTAAYKGSFTLSALEKGNTYQLQLGKVAELAEVFMNGVPCGTAWTAPFNIDVTKALQKGSNVLEIRVTNTWANRLEGDALLPEAQRLTWTDGKYRKKTRDLLDAGLLGPLKLTVTGTPEVATPMIAPLKKKTNP